MIFITELCTSEADRNIRRFTESAICHLTQASVLIDIIALSTVKIPNGIGMSLAIIQLALFVIFPMKEGKQALAKRLCGIDCTSSKKDVEAAKGASG